MKKADTEKKEKQERKEKQEKLEQEYTQRLEEKITQLADLDKKGGSAYDNFLVAIEKPPYKSENPKTKEQYIKLVNKYVSAFKIDASLDGFLNKLSTEQLTLLMEIVLKNLQMVSEGAGTNAVNPTLLLKLYSHILETKGVSYQLRATSKRYSL